MASSQHRDNHAAMHAGFGWRVPATFNIAQVCCRRWAQRPDATKRIAIQTHVPGTTATFHSYAELQQAADRLAGALDRKSVV